MQKKLTIKSPKQTALFIGRFQPFHKGHLHALLSLARRYHKVIIGIGSAQKGFTPENPFTGTEREEMINKIFGNKTTIFKIIQIPDINDNNKWVNHVKKIVGPFDIAFTNNALVLNLFKKANVQVHKHPLFKPKIYKATHIRQLISQNKPWQNLVPKQVEGFLKNIQAADRLKTLLADRNIVSLLENLNLPISNLPLWQTAFRHRSYLHEHKSENLASNERLEFLGDAVLELIITEFLYNKYPDAEEGVMTTQRAALVRTENLGKVAKKLNLNVYLCMSFGEEKNGGRTNDSLLANTFEAVLGALYLTHGLAASRDFIYKHLLSEMPEDIRSKEIKDFKTKLQEFFQENYKTLPTYTLEKEEGSSHNKTFIFSVKFKNKVLGKGKGRNKQEAQQAAAEEAYIQIAKRGKNQKMF